MNMNQELRDAALCNARPVLHGATLERRVARLDSIQVLQGMENATMPRVKQASKQKRMTKAAAPALGAAGLTFSVVGGASASAMPTTDVTPIQNYLPTQAVTLGDEEMADVSQQMGQILNEEL